MYDAADSILAQKLPQVEGVGQVFVGGGAQPAVRAEVNPTLAQQSRHRSRPCSECAYARQRQSPQGTGFRSRRGVRDHRQRPVVDGRSIPLADRGLSNKGAPVRSRRCRRRAGFGRGRAQRGSVQRQARGADHSVPPARGEHHRHRRSRLCAIAPAAGLHFRRLSILVSSWTGRRPFARRYGTSRLLSDLHRPGHAGRLSSFCGTCGPP